MRVGKYLLIVLGTIAGLTAASIALTTYADPYRLFGRNSLAVAVKPRIYQRAMMAKTYQIERVRPRTILLGNSRTEIGIDPASDVWPSHFRPVFNAALAGRDLLTAWRILQDDFAISPPRAIVLEADFFDFLSNAPDPMPSGDDRRFLVDHRGAHNPERQVQELMDIYNGTLSIDAVWDSIVTLFNQANQASVTMTPLGFNPLRQYQNDVHTIGYRGMFEHEWRMYAKKFPQYPHPNFKQPEQMIEFHYLSKICDIAREKQTRLVIFVPPYHESLLGYIRAAGLWPSFEAWKRALVQTVEGCDNRVSEPAPHIVRLIDFSGYNQFTEEPVPQRTGNKVQMRWYWEPGHFKPALGDHILRQILARGAVPRFGTELDSSSIEAALSTIREDALHRTK